MGQLKLYTFMLYNGVDIKELEVKAPSKTYAMQTVSDNYFPATKNKWLFTIKYIYVNNIDKGKFVIALGEKGNKKLKGCNATDAFNELSTVIGSVPPKIIDFLCTAKVGQVLTEGNLKIYCVQYYKDVSN